MTGVVRSPPDETANRSVVSYAVSARLSFRDMLDTLDHILAKAQDAGLADDVLARKLTEHMFPLELQIRVALNQVLLALNQVGGRHVPLEETAYQTIAEARRRVAAVRSLLDSADPMTWAAADAVVDLTLPNGVRFRMSAEEDVRDWLLPNLYFHVTMAYALLRSSGLAVGKMDFLPRMRRHEVQEPG